MSDDGNVAPQLNVSAQDILAAIAFEAQRIVAATQQHAAGYPFPPPALLQEVIARMTHLNSILLQVGGLITETNSTSLNVSSAMKAELN